MVLQPQYSAFRGTVKVANKGIKKPNGNYRKVLAIMANTKDSRPYCVGYITFDACDNHKRLWLRKNDRLVVGPVIPQRRHTDIDLLASIVHINKSRLVLRDKTGYTGPKKPVGAPVFNSSSIAGGFGLV